MAAANYFSRVDKCEHHFLGVDRGTPLAKYFSRVDKCVNRPRYVKPTPRRSFPRKRESNSSWTGVGPRLRGGDGRRVCRAVSLSGVAGAKDLVGGAEDTLGRTLSESLALAP
jgi:hypothetical protein